MELKFLLLSVLLISSLFTELESLESLSSIKEEFLLYVGNLSDEKFFIIFLFIILVLFSRSLFTDLLSSSSLVESFKFTLNFSFNFSNGILFIEAS